MRGLAYHFTLGDASAEKRSSKRRAVHFRYLAALLGVTAGLLLVGMAGCKRRDGGKPGQGDTGRNPLESSAASDADIALDAGNSDGGPISPPLRDFTGRVTDESGRPLARARVIALDEAGRGVGVADSNSEGVFALFQLLGATRLEVRFPGRIAQALDLTDLPKAVEPTRLPDALLPAGVPIFGRLLGGGDAPIDGGLVLAEREAGWRGRTAKGQSAAAQQLAPPTFWSDAAIGGTTSDPDGRFVLTGLRAGFFRLAATHPKHAPVEIRHVAAPGEEVVLQLPRYVALGGFVALADGSPAESATVTVAGSGLWPPREVRTDVSGAFQFQGLTEGIYDLRARRGAAEASPVLEGIERFADTVESPIELKLEPALQTVGLVADDSTAAPIAGAQVTIASDTLASLSDRFTTDATGKFVVPPLPPGKYALSVEHPDYLGLWGKEWVVEPQSSPVTIRLTLGRIVRGVVRSSTGDPIAGANVVGVVDETSGGVWSASSGEAAARQGVFSGGSRVKPSGELGVLKGPIPFPTPTPTGGWADDAQVVGGGYVTDAQGRFELSGLPPGALQITASHLDFARPETVRVNSAAAASSIELVLTPGAKVIGRVFFLDAAAREIPLSGALLTMSSATGGANRDGAGVFSALQSSQSAESADAWRDVDASASRRVWVGSAGEVALSNIRGEFTLSKALGRVRVDVSLPGYGDAGKVIDISPKIAKSGGSVTLDFILTRADSRLVGRVLDPLGFGLAKARVEIAAAGGRPRAAVSDTRGDFALERLGLGPYSIRVTHPSYPPLLVDRKVLPRLLEVGFVFGGGIDGVVIDERSRGAVAGAKVAVLDGGKELRQTIADARGRFKLLGVPAGQVELEFSAANYVTAKRRVQIASARRSADEITLREVAAELTRAAALSGRVLDLRGNPVANAELKLIAQRSGDAALQTRSNQSGDYVFEGILPGEYDVLATWPSGRARYERLRLGAGERRENVVLSRW